MMWYLDFVFLKHCYSLHSLSLGFYVGCVSVLLGLNRHDATAAVFFDKYKICEILVIALSCACLA